MKPISKEAYQLLHQGTLALADIEASGIRIDTEYCKKAKRDLQLQIDKLEKETGDLPEVQQWKEICGAKFNINSGQQLGDLLFNHLGIEPIKKTEKGNNSTDEESLSKINLPLIQNLLRIKKLKKTKSTYLEAFIREEVGGFIYPFFGLIGVRTYRSQSDHPNFQNIPIRDPEIGKICRQAIIPRPGHILVERDYKGIEVSVSGCYHKDPTYLYDITQGDMHRDVVMKCFLLPSSFLQMKWGEKPLKNIRYIGKNMFVFPQFYGDYYGNCARSQWEQIDKPEYALPDGTSLRKHLASLGIRSYTKFENHIKDIENWFWKDKYPVYTRWKKNWVRNYWNKGYFDTLTGFRCQGLMKDNKVVNYPIQGSAFHCLLWSLIQLNEKVKKYKFKSKIIGQIHDCVLTDEDPKESDNIEEIFQQVMSKDLVKHWPWIITPMIVETEKTGVDESWYYKKGV